MLEASCNLFLFVLSVSIGGWPAGRPAASFRRVPGGYDELIKEEENA